MTPSSASSVSRPERKQKKKTPKPPTVLKEPPQSAPLLPPAAPDVVIDVKRSAEARKRRLPLSTTARAAAARIAAAIIAAALLFSTLRLALGSVIVESATPMPLGTRVAFFGDSITRGAGLSVQSERFSDVYCAVRACTAVNHGADGANTYTIARTAISRASILDRGTVIFAGTNDVQESTPLDVNHIGRLKSTITATILATMYRDSMVALRTSGTVGLSMTGSWTNGDFLLPLPSGLITTSPGSALSQGLTSRFVGVQLTIGVAGLSVGLAFTITVDGQLMNIGTLPAPSSSGGQEYFRSYLWDFGTVAPRLVTVAHTGSPGSYLFVDAFYSFNSPSTAKPVVVAGAGSWPSMNSPAKAAYNSMLDAVVHGYHAVPGLEDAEITTAFPVRECSAEAGTGGDDNLLAESTPIHPDGAGHARLAANIADVTSGTPPSSTGPTAPVSASSTGHSSGASTGSAGPVGASGVRSYNATRSGQTSRRCGTGTTDPCSTHSTTLTTDVRSTTTEAISGDGAYACRDVVGAPTCDDCLTPGGRACHGDAEFLSSAHCAGRTCAPGQCWCARVTTTTSREEQAIQVDPIYHDTNAAAYPATVFRALPQYLAPPSPGSRHLSSADDQLAAVDMSFDGEKFDVDYTPAPPAYVGGPAPACYAVIQINTAAAHAVLLVAGKASYDLPDHAEEQAGHIRVRVQDEVGGIHASFSFPHPGPDPCAGTGIGWWTRALYNWDCMSDFALWAAYVLIAATVLYAMYMARHLKDLVSWFFCCPTVTYTSDKAPSRAARVVAVLSAVASGLFILSMLVRAPMVAGAPSAAAADSARPFGPRDACSNGHAISAPAASCSYDGTTRTCTFGSAVRFLLPAGGQRVCLTFTDPADSAVLGELHVAVSAVTALVDYDYAYNTAPHSIIQSSHHYCAKSGPCGTVGTGVGPSDDPHGIFRSDNPDLMDYPGATTAHDSPGCAAAGCFYCSSSCTYTRVAVVPSTLNTCRVKATPRTRRRATLAWQWWDGAALAATGTSLAPTRSGTGPYEPVELAVADIFSLLPITGISDSKVKAAYPAFVSVCPTAVGAPTGPAAIRGYTAAEASATNDPRYGTVGDIQFPTSPQRAGDYRIAPDLWRCSTGKYDSCYARGKPETLPPWIASSLALATGDYPLAKLGGKLPGTWPPNTPSGTFWYLDSVARNNASGAAATIATEEGAFDFALEFSLDTTRPITLSSVQSVACPAADALGKDPTLTGYANSASGCALEFSAISSCLPGSAVLTVPSDGYFVPTRQSVLLARQGSTASRFTVTGFCRSLTVSDMAFTLTAGRSPPLTLRVPSASLLTAESVSKDNDAFVHAVVTGGGITEDQSVDPFDGIAGPFGDVLSLLSGAFACRTRVCAYLTLMLYVGAASIAMWLVYRLARRTGPPAGYQRVPTRSKAV